MATVPGQGRLFSRRREYSTVHIFYPEGKGPEGDEVGFRHPASGWGFLPLPEAEVPERAVRQGDCLTWTSCWQ